MAANVQQSTPLQAAVQIMMLDPGLYSITFGADRLVQSDLGFSFPRVRLDAPAAGPGSILVAVQGRDGWLAQGGDTALVQVHGERAGLLLTTYQVAGSGAPQLRVSRLADHRASATPSAAPAATPGSEPAPPRVQGALSGLVHVSGHGDVPTDAEGWGEAPAGSGLAVEGFQFVPPAGLPPQAIEYQGVLGVDWTTPWVAGGEFAGSRGLSLPLLGFAVRLAPALRGAWRCTYGARFQDGSEAQAAEGAPCLAASGAALQALRVTLVPVAASVAPVAEKPAARPEAAAAAPKAASPRAAPPRAAAPKAIPPKAAAPRRAAPAPAKAAPPARGKAVGTRKGSKPTRRA